MVVVRDISRAKYLRIRKCPSPTHLLTRVPPKVACRSRGGLSRYELNGFGWFEGLEVGAVGVLEFWDLYPHSDTAAFTVLDR